MPDQAANVKLTSVRLLTADGLKLEGLIYHFDATAKRPAVVVCHPHPLYGGSMRGGLIPGLARTLADRGFVVLRFNFRGVGESEGRFDAGYGEKQDVAAAVDALFERDDVAGDHVYLAGWSFGARVGLEYGATDERLAGFAVVGLPTDGLEESFMAADTRPKLVIVGQHDRFASAAKLRRWAENMAGPARIVVLADTDHFLTNREQEGFDIIASFLDGLAEEVSSK
jgi:alpha/beta superfamily hydrolase